MAAVKSAVLAIAILFPALATAQDELLICDTGDVAAAVDWGKLSATSGRAAVAAIDRR